MGRRGLERWGLGGLVTGDVFERVQGIYMLSGQPTAL